MKGDHLLRAVRRKGLRPRMVTIETVHDPSRLWERWPRLGLSFAELLIEPHERVVDVDWRVLVGLHVTIHGENPERIADVAQACEPYAATIWTHLFRWRGAELESAAFTVFKESPQ